MITIFDPDINFPTPYLISNARMAFRSSFISCIFHSSHPGCLCKEGWTGDHCDFRHKNDLPQSFSNTKGNRSANMTAIIFSCMALTIMVIIAGAVFVTRKLIAKEQVQAQIDAEQSKGNVANVNEATEDGMVSEDFYDLKDVELI